MTQWLTMTAALIPVIGVIAVGMLARRINWLTEEADRTLVNLTVRLLLPCFMLMALNRNSALDRIGELIAPPAFGFGLTLLGFGVCAAVLRLASRPLGIVTLAQKRTFILCAGMFNYGYIPIPLVEQLYKGGAELPNLVLHNVGVEIAMWTVGMLILSGKLGKNWWTGVLNPVVISILLALVLRFTGGWGVLVEHGKPLLKLIDMLGQCAIPLGLLLSGATIADVQKQASLREGWRSTTASVLLRLGAIPALFVLIAFTLPISVELRHVIVIQAAMPAAVFPIVLARHYGGDAPTAVRIVLMTHVVSLLTTPLWLAYGL